jgi:hypothetical protein
MKARKKPLGTRAQIEAMKERERRLALTVTVALIIVIILVSGFLIYSMSYSPSEEAGTLPEPTLQFKPANSNPELKAAVVDQLGLTAPNETFLQTAASILTEANYTVDYYSGENVTVNFYRYLPTGGYKLILLRVHSAPFVKDGKEVSIVNLFTSEPYTTSKYVSEQTNDELVTALYYEGSPEYFAITPSFIEKCMKGSFSNATIIMMGCDGLKYATTAQAFIEKGAKAYISWDAPVSSSHTDTATTNLLQHLLTERQTIEESISQTFKDVGYDPIYFSQLAYYPSEAGEQTIENFGKK